MKIKAFAVYDSKGLRYGMPMFLQSTGEVLRSFQDVANQPDSVICKHASDFVLYEVGYYDDSTGKLVGIDPFINLGNASEFKKVAKDVVIYNPAAEKHDEVKK